MTGQELFFVEQLSFFSLCCLLVDSLSLKILALRSHSVLKFDMQFRYLEELASLDFSHPYLTLSIDQVFLCACLIIGTINYFLHESSIVKVKMLIETLK